MTKQWHYQIVTYLAVKNKNSLEKKKKMDY